MEGMPAGTAQKVPGGRMRIQPRPCPIEHRKVAKGVQGHVEAADEDGQFLQGEAESGGGQETGGEEEGREGGGEGEEGEEGWWIFQEKMSVNMRHSLLSFLGSILSIVGRLIFYTFI
mmetsp:Transcript_32029/g.67789  ORF Transcript_32029/g.67789 Transcript_32029/m.67789 type:complete len:117 (+) Transcript_32029:1209-1559(+)